MNFMKNQKSDEGFNEDHHSASSGSRRVMWKLSDDEETFDSVVNYRRLTYHKSLADDAVADTSTTAADAALPATSNNNNDSVQSVPTRPRSGSDAWTYIFNLIKTNKLTDELTQPAALALRYKPSKESLKSKRSKEKHAQQQQQQQASDKPNRKLVITECCALPPHQRAVIEELPPKFSQRYTNDTDSSDNGEISKAAAMIIATVASKAPPCARMSVENAKSPVSSMHALLPLPPPGSPVSNQSNRIATKRKTQTGKAAKATNSSQKLSNNVAATNTFRQRQLELHRYRLQVEQRRLELLDLKIAREREEAVRQQILFQKDLEFKSTQIKQVMDDMTSL